jgi:hypothetical protein
MDISMCVCLYVLKLFRVLCYGYMLSYASSRTAHLISLTKTRRQNCKRPHVVKFTFATWTDVNQMCRSSGHCIDIWTGDGDTKC